MAIIKTRLLKPRAQVISTARTIPLNFSEFFQDRPGLSLLPHWGESSRERLGIEARKPIQSIPERFYVMSILKKDAYDRDIRKDLPENHLSNLEDIAGFIEAQPEGRQGVLLVEGYENNVFYVEGKAGIIFATSIHWHSNKREWVIGAWYLDEFDKWGAGLHVFCPGTIAS